jgi:predicted N-acetyltransferase YhbS
MMTTIRPETMADTAAIADIHARAFEERSDEAVIVALLRQRPSYDPALSLVAEQNNILVGHTLFNPCSVRIDGQDVRAVYLAPIGIRPQKQKQGIGSQLIEEGHRLAKERGYALSFLLGHTDYYTRFGYQPAAFGDSSLLCEVTEADTPALTTRAPHVSDIPALMQLWQQAEHAVDFALRPDTALIDWLTPNPSMQAQVYLRDADGQPVGYTRGQPDDLRCFLAASAEVARAMVQHLAADTDKTYLSLPLHPHSNIASALSGEINAETWEAAMVCVLSDEDAAPYTAYRAALDAGERPAGRPLWPSAFDLA